MKERRVLLKFLLSMLAFVVIAIYDYEPVNAAICIHKYAAANCTTPKKCTKCGATSGKALGHSTSTSHLNPTCTAPGYNVTKCSRCSYTSKVATSEMPKGHAKVQDKVLLGATCTTKGVASYKCSRCGTGMGSGDIAALGHSTTTSHLNPTCTAPGYNVTKCSRCTYTSKVATSEPAKGHKKVQDKVQLAPTCTTKGVASYKCSTCGAGLGSGDLAALGHSTSTSHLNPTCTETGYNVTKCSRCTYTSKVATSEPAKGHTKVLDKVQQPATCTSLGTAIYKCSVCGTGLGSESIAKTKHDLQETSYIDPTCTLPGYRVFSCKNCTYTSKVASSEQAKGHKYVHISCTEDRCSVCKKVVAGGTGHTQPQNSDGYSCTGLAPYDYDTYCEKGNKHQYQCATCGSWECSAEHTFRTVNSQNFAGQDNPNGTYHFVFCICGATRLVPCTPDSKKICTVCKMKVTHVCKGNRRLVESDRVIDGFGHKTVCEAADCPGVMESHTFETRILNTLPSGYYVPLGNGQYLVYQCVVCGTCDFMDDNMRGAIDEMGDEDKGIADTIGSVL